jgi:hypothetical protein
MLWCGASGVTGASFLIPAIFTSKDYQVSHFSMGLSTKHVEYNSTWLEVLMSAAHMKYSF